MNDNLLCLQNSDSTQWVFGITCQLPVTVAWTSHRATAMVSLSPVSFVYSRIDYRTANIICLTPLQFTKPLLFYYFYAIIYLDSDVFDSDVNY